MLSSFVAHRKLVFFFFSSYNATDASDRSCENIFPVHNPVVFSDNRILFIQVLITSNSRHKTTVLNRLK